MAYQTEIEKIDPDDDKRSELEELCVSTKSKILQLLGGSRRHDVTLADTSLNSQSTNWNRLPKLKLPTFSGKYSDYTSFITSFKNLVHNEASLPVIEKFNHLLTCLSGDALKTVQAFQVNEENYSKALSRLSERYDKKCLIFMDNVEQLFELPKCNEPNASKLRNAVDTISAIYDSLLSLGNENEILNAFLIHLVMSKVDPITKSKWNDSLDYSTVPTWEECSKLIIRRCQAIDIDDEKLQESVAHSKQKLAFFNKNKPKSTLTCATTNEKNRYKCQFCKSTNHYMYKCESYISKPFAEKFDFVKRNGLCINCLNKGHSVSACKSSHCRVCKKAHHTTLHKYDVPNNVVDTIAPAGNSFERSSLPCVGGDDMVILATAVVYIKNKFGEYQLARAMLDSGSQVNFISEDAAQRLQLRRERDTLFVSGIGEKTSNVTQKVSISLKSRLNEFKFSADVWVIHSIASQQPESNISISDWNIPPNIDLADPYFYKRQRVDILLGAETFFELLSVGQIKLHPTLPMLQKTLLGWVVSGKYKPNMPTKTCNIVYKVEDHNLPEIDKSIRKFWEMEEVPSPKSSLTNEQKACEEHFVRTTKLLPSGRFEVRLPFKIEPIALGTSFDIASRRFYSLERRLAKTPQIRTMYNDFMKEYLALGHMESVKNLPHDSHFFIPHQCVLRMQSTSTKLRVVFDASARTSSQVSLNDTLMVGPTIQPDLYTILLRFRLYKYAITADISKMYRQILVNQADKKYQLIVWRDNTNIPLQIYQLNTVTYGTAPAPFLAIRCLEELSQRFKDEFPIGANVLRENFYVDDMLCGADTPEELGRIKNEVVGILSKANFQLAKWFSNYEPADDSIRELKMNENQQTRTLGITWNPKLDTFHFNLLSEFEHLKASKRNILSIASRLFDPLGLLCPIIIIAKIIIQDLWLQKLDWDESIPMHMATSWQHFKQELNSVQAVVVPRYVNTVDGEQLEIHGFSDASIRAYGCCIYVRKICNGVTTTHLLTAKSKVAPLKTKSLPRLELCGAHLLAKLWNTIRSTLNFNITNIIFWTDSEILLYWLKSHPSSLSTFVGNRVSEIQDWCNSVSWRYVPTKHNPADLASRGCKIKDLTTNSLWFNGPGFLAQEQSAWPINPKF